MNTQKNTQPHQDNYTVSMITQEYESLEQEAPVSYGEALCEAFADAAYNGSGWSVIQAQDAYHRGEDLQFIEDIDLNVKNRLITK